MSTCDHICRECGQVMHCRHCRPVDRARIAELEAALRAIFDVADSAGNETQWADMVSAELTDERRALLGGKTR